MGGMALDTLTHAVMGVTLAGLARLDPVVAENPTLATAVLLATTIGSQAPDFDGLVRLGGPAAYVRYHRGPTHSLPALLAWPWLIAGGVELLLGPVPFWHLLGWTSVAVFVHAFTDLLNSYGTQVLWPFSRRWVAWHVLPIFDPVLFALHVLGLVLWAMGIPPGPLFAAVYAATAAWGAIRWAMRRRVARSIRRAIGDPRTDTTVLPTFFPATWNVIADDGQAVRVGTWRNGRLTWRDVLTRPPHDHPAVREARAHPYVRALLSFTRYAVPRVHPVAGGTEVRWVDVRFRAADGHYPLVAAVYLDRSGRVKQAAIGWMYRESHVRKKLGLPDATDA